MNKLIIGMFLCVFVFASCGGNKTKDEKDDTAGLSETTSMVEKVLHDTQQPAGNEVTSDAEAEVEIFSDLVSDGRPSVVDFTATWCGPCKMMKPVFHKLASEYGKKYNFITIDIDERPDLAEKYGIQAVPTFVFLDEDGNEGNRLTGYMEESAFRHELDNPVWY